MHPVFRGIKPNEFRLTKSTNCDYLESDEVTNTFGRVSLNNIKRLPKSMYDMIKDVQKDGKIIRFSHDKNYTLFESESKKYCLVDNYLIGYLKYALEYYQGNILFFGCSKYIVVFSDKNMYLLCGKTEKGKSCIKSYPDLKESLEIMDEETLNLEKTKREKLIKSGRYGIEILETV